MKVKEGERSHRDSDRCGPAPGGCQTFDGVIKHIEITSVFEVEIDGFLEHRYRFLEV